MSVESNLGIQRLSSRPGPDRKREIDALPEEEAKQRNLQRVFVEVLAEAGIPFEIAFQIADVSWEIHQIQLRKNQEYIDNPPPKRIEPELSDEERELREAKSREVWSRLEENPSFVEALGSGIEDLEQGRYFNWEVMKRESDIPKLKISDEVSETTPQS